MSCIEWDAHLEKSGAGQWVMADDGSGSGTHRAYRAANAASMARRAATDILRDQKRQRNGHLTFPPNALAMLTCPLCSAVCANKTAFQCLMLETLIRSSQP